MMDLDRLAQLAGEATPGPWEDDGQGWVISVEIADAVADDLRECDAAFIAACDPQTVAALVEAVKAAQAYTAWIDRQHTPIGSPVDAGAPVFKRLRDALAPFASAQSADAPLPEGEEEA